MTDDNKSPLLVESLCPTVPMLMASFFAIAYTGVIELTLRILLMFRKRQGLYFWSLLIATWGVALSTTGSVLDFAQISVSVWFIATISLIGWVSMVSGQCFVLYSRLHLVLHDATKIRAILVLIITNAVIFHTSVGLLYMGSQSAESARFTHIYNIFEKIQLTVFALQEILISSVYIYSATRFFGGDDLGTRNNRRTTMRELLVINFALIALDILVVSLQYANLYDVQISLKVAVYSIKLRLEFDVLSRLVQDSRRHSSRLEDNLRICE